MKFGLLLAFKLKYNPSVKNYSYKMAREMVTVQKFNKECPQYHSVTAA